MVSGDSREDCRATVEAMEPEYPLLLVETSPFNDGYAAGRGLVVLGGGTVVATPGYREPRLAIVVHQIRPCVGFPALLRRQDPLVSGRSTQRGVRVRQPDGRDER